MKPNEEKEATFHVPGPACIEQPDGFPSGQQTPACSTKKKQPVGLLIEKLEGNVNHCLPDGQTKHRVLGLLSSL